MDTSNGFTPIQRKMLDVLSDGKFHTHEELHACCKPSGPNAVKVHLYNLRVRMNPRGHDIMTRRVNGKWFYRHVRLLASPYGADN